MSDSNAALCLSPRGLAFVMRSEGFVPVEYNDTAGHPTIGYGHKLLAGEQYDDGITREQAANLLHQDMAVAEQEIHSFVKVALTQAQYDALVSFVYNIGAGAFAASTLLKFLNAGNYHSAADELLHWNKVRENGVLVESAGLTARRAAEHVMFLEVT